MELNMNFKRSLERTINLCQPLADWFERNQESMAYFGLTHSGCNHLENSLASADIVALGRMANAALTWLEKSNKVVLPEDKAYLAAVAIAEVYELEKEDLSETAKVQYYINVEELQKDETQEKGRRL